MAEPEIEPRPSLLDAFGAKPDDPPSATNLPQASALVMPPQRQGAIKVEVKRDEREVLQKIKALAAAAGEDWYYRFPAKDKKTGKTNWIQGPTIKAANAIARVYGNVEIDTRVIDVGDSWLIMARFLDLETGFAMTRPYQQRKSQKGIGDDPDRQRDAALQIGVSKAIRNVVTNSLEGISEFAFEEAQNSLVNRIGKELPKWRENTVKKLESKVDLKRVEAVMGRAVNEWLAPDVAQLIAVMKSISEGMATVDEQFPPLGKPVNDNGKSANDNGKGQLEQFAKEENSGDHAG